MKQLNNYIQEKLKIKADTKIKKGKELDLLNVPNVVDNYVADKILYVWGFKKGSYGTKKVGEAIKKWVLDNNIEDVQPAADPETLNEFVPDAPKEIIELYDDSLKLNEECQYRLASAKEIYVLDKFNQVYASSNIIALISYTGTLYCIPVNTL